MTQAGADGAHGAHDYIDDPRNADVVIYVNGRLVPRARAVVSVFDAGFVLGDGVGGGCGSWPAGPCFSNSISTVCMRARRPSLWTSV
jgi:branched-chain amino acid aminotransferase